MKHLHKLIQLNSLEECTGVWYSQIFSEALEVCMNHLLGEL